MSGFLQRRINYFSISNNVQEFILDNDIITAISRDHSPIVISLSKKKQQNNKSSGFENLLTRYCLIRFLEKS